MIQGEHGTADGAQGIGCRGISARAISCLSSSAVGVCVCVCVRARCRLPPVVSADDAVDGRMSQNIAGRSRRAVLCNLQMQ